MKIMIKDSYYRDLKEGQVLEVKKWDSCMEDTYGAGFVTLDGEKVINAKHCYIIDDELTVSRIFHISASTIEELTKSYLLGVSVEVNDGIPERIIIEL